MSINTTKFMVIVETKNYPVVTVRPAIQRYARIRKRMNSSEIAQCLSCYAIVTLEKNNGSKVRLTSSNFKDILRSYTSQLNDIKIDKGISKEESKNTARVEKIKETQVNKVESLATVEEDTTKKITGEQIKEFDQPDPEDEDEFSDDPYYEGDE